MSDRAHARPARSARRSSGRVLALIDLSTSRRQHREQRHAETHRSTRVGLAQRRPSGSHTRTGTGSRPLAARAPFACAQPPWASPPAASSARRGPAMWARPRRRQCAWKGHRTSSRSMNSKARDQLAGGRRPPTTTGRSCDDPRRTIDQLRARTPAHHRPSMQRIVDRYRPPRRSGRRPTPHPGDWRKQIALGSGARGLEALIQPAISRRAASPTPSSAVKNPATSTSPARRRGRGGLQASR